MSRENVEVVRKLYDAVNLHDAACSWTSPAGALTPAPLHWLGVVRW